MTNTSKRLSRLLAVVLCGATFFSGCSNTTDSQKVEETVPDTALELVEDMGNGWNLGNTMESVVDNGDFATDFEQAWGNIKTTQECIDGIKGYNFKSVRIPVAWSNMMSDDGNYTINQDYFNRVDEIVDYVLNDDMYAIINIHWDGGWWADFGSAKQEVRDEALKKYQAMWTQIADHYKDYSKKLIFESANEELGSKFQEDNEDFTEDECYETCNAINQEFVDIVRNSGGNNDSRFLLIAGYNTDIDMTCDDRFTMPTDTIDDHLMVSVHYYTPSQYCIASSEGNSWGYRDSWGTPVDKAMMNANFEKMTKFTEQGYGVVIGEYGVTLKFKDGERSLKDGTFDYMQSVVNISNDYNFCPILWDAGNWYSRTRCKFDNEELANIYLNADGGVSQDTTVTE